MLKVIYGIPFELIEMCDVHGWCLQERKYTEENGGWDWNGLNAIENGDYLIVCFPGELDMIEWEGIIDYDYSEHKSGVPKGLTLRGWKKLLNRDLHATLIKNPENLEKN